MTKKMKKHWNDNRIIGVDFDDTLFLNSWPANYDEPNERIINWVRQKQKEGCFIILITCREGKALEAAVKACEGVNLHFDAVNENSPAMIARFGDCRKIYCDLYLDDKNITLRQAAYGLY